LMPVVPSDHGRVNRDTRSPLTSCVKVKDQHAFCPLHDIVTALHISPGARARVAEAGGLGVLPIPATDSGSSLGGRNLSA
jgi:hypothetical protein